MHERFPLTSETNIPSQGTSNDPISAAKPVANPAAIKPVDAKATAAKLAVPELTAREFATTNPVPTDYAATKPAAATVVKKPDLVGQCQPKNLDSSDCFQTSTVTVSATSAPGTTDKRRDAALPGQGQREDDEKSDVGPPKKKAKIADEDGPGKDVVKPAPADPDSNPTAATAHSHVKDPPQVVKMRGTKAFQA